MTRRFAVAFALFLLTFALVSSAGPAVAQDFAGEIVHTIGEVEVTRRDGSMQPAADGLLLQSGDTIHTGRRGEASLLLADETLMRLHRNTTFLLKNSVPSAGWQGLRRASTSPLSNSSRYELRAGQLWLRNKNRSATIDVTTPTVSASIRGTEFNVRLEPDTTTVLTVLEGVVAVSNPFGSLTATAAEQVVAAPGTAPRKTMLLEPRDAVQWVLQIPLPAIARVGMARFADGAALERQRTELDARLRAAPGDPALMFALAEVLYNLGRLEEAAALLEQLKGISSTNPPARILLGLSYLRLGRTQEAVAELRGVPEAVRDQSVSAMAGLILALSESGKQDEAQQLLEAALSRSPNEPALQDLQARIHLISREFSEARAISGGLLERRQDYAPAWVTAALLELAADNKGLALRHAERAVELAPSSAEAQLALSYARQAHFELDGATEAAVLAHESAPGDPRSVAQLAKLLFGAGHNDEALAVLNEVSREDADLLAVRGFLELAQRNTDEAIALFKRASSLDPAAADPHLGLSLALMRRGEVARALEEISKAVLLEPRRSILLSYWGKMLYQLRRFPQALDMLKLAAELDPRDPTPHLYRAIILRDLNRPTDAINALHAAFALNNNRAVFRSSFLLDRDLAVKNVDLSILYEELGLHEWAKKSAIDAVKLDYANYSAHLFLSGAYSDLEARDNARDTELLLAQLMLPANNNSFNTYADYTSFFETPAYRGLISGVIGNRDTQNGSIVLNGGAPDAGLAGGATINIERTDGYRETNPSHGGGGAAFIKWDPTAEDSFFLQGLYTESRERDDFRADFEADAPVDVQDRRGAEGEAVTLGYRHRFSPAANLLAALQYQDTRIDVDDRDEFTIELDDQLLPLELRNDRELKSPLYAGQLLFQQRLSSHQLMAGAVLNWGDERNDSVEDTYALLEGGPLLIDSHSINSDQDQQMQSYYLYESWEAAEWLRVEGALYYDRLADADSLTDTKQREEEFSPRLGFILKPTATDTVRIAAFRYLQPYLTIPRMDPSDIAGIVVVRNTLEGSLAEEAAAAWEHTWGTGYLTNSLFYMEREISLRLDNESDRLRFDGRYRGAEVALNQLLWNGAGLALSYRFTDATDEFDSDIDREDHLFKAGLRYLSSLGWSARVAQTYRRENFSTSTGRQDENIWITDVGLAYEFPEKAGNAAIVVNNVFDERFNWVTGTGNVLGREPSRELLFVLSLNF